MKIDTKTVRSTVAFLDSIIEEYKKNTKEQKRDWRTYEQQFAKRLRQAFHDLRPLVVKATSIQLVRGDHRGQPRKLSLENKLLILLLKHFGDKSNRGMSLATVIFSWIKEIDVSYKTIERLYSDHEVCLALQNLQLLMLQQCGVDNVDATGDGTGFSLSIKEHYATNAAQQKEKGKTQRGRTKIVYYFALRDLRTKLYISFGTSFKCEKDAYTQAMNMAREIGINIKSIRLDRYYSAQLYVEQLRTQWQDIKLYLIPKKNATVQGPWAWKRMLHEFVHNTTPYLTEYFQRNQSESGFAEDKKRTGWRVGQKRPERVHTANALTTTWHNLYWLGAND